MKPIRVHLYYWDREECEQAVKLEKAINACSHIPKDVKIIKKPHPSKLAYSVLPKGKRT